MKPEIKSFLKDACIEVPAYAALVLAYFFVVLHLLGDWLNRLFTDNRSLYAVVALLLIGGQGMALELLTSALLRRIRAGRGN